MKSTIEILQEAERDPHRAWQHKLNKLPAFGDINAEEEQPEDRQIAAAMAHFNRQVENGGIGQYILNGYWEEEVGQVMAFLEKHQEEKPTFGRVLQMLRNVETIVQDNIGDDYGPAQMDEWKSDVERAVMNHDGDRLADLLGSDDYREISDAHRQEMSSWRSGHFEDEEEDEEDGESRADYLLNTANSEAENIINRIHEYFDKDFDTPYYDEVGEAFTADVNDVLNTHYTGNIEKIDRDVVQPAIGAVKSGWGKGKAAINRFLGRDASRS